MEEIYLSNCPVCGEPRQKVLSDSRCVKCNFSNAYIRSFSSEEVFKLWQSKVNEAKLIYDKQTHEKRFDYLLKKYSAGCLSAGSSHIAFLNPDTHAASILNTNGSVQLENNVKQISIGGNYFAVLYLDGTVKVFGSEDGRGLYGQCEVGDWVDIEYVFETADCTYGVKNDGTVVYKGNNAFSSVASWKNIKKIAGCETHILGLTANKNVLISGHHANSDNVSNWTDVKEVFAARNSSLALHENGKVSFCGRANLSQSISQWSDIVAASMDVNNVICLDTKGKTYVVSTRTFSLTNKNRNSQWENIISAVISNRGIVAITESGSVKISDSPAANLFTQNWDKYCKNEIN